MPRKSLDEEDIVCDREPLLDEGEGYDLRNFDANGSATRSNSGHEPTRRLPWIRTFETSQHRIVPIFPHLQQIPIRNFNRLAPTKSRKLVVFSIAGVSWLAIFTLLLVRSASNTPSHEFGPVRRLSCTSSPWPNDDKDCAVNGAKCLPFGNTTFAFRCPPDCASAQALEPRFIGSQPIRYQSWVIGGGSSSTMNARAIYRGDSWICAAAIHANMIQSSRGGCGVLSLNGEASDFPSSESNGIKSIAFDSTFPVSFSLRKYEEPDSQCYDQRFTTLTLSVLFTSAISLLANMAHFFFFPIFTVGFFQVALISDAPAFDDYLLVVQYAVARFLPAVFVGYTVYRFCAKRTLADLEAPVERTVLWLGGFWFGALENYTLDKLPLQRLTPRDLSQPGAWIVLIVIVALIALLALVQAWAFWRDGRFWRYLSIYLVLLVTLIILTLLPGLNLRIHHYILALLLLPGTAIQTRPSLLFQGLLVGLFVNGVARWGFASLLETDQFLNRKGPLGTLLPNITAPIIQGANISFQFALVPEDWDGISMLVNGVERQRWPNEQGNPVLSWTRLKDVPYFFRFGYYRLGFVNGILQGDYTEPATWFVNGTWTAYMGSNT